jgi:hypothetical protein
MPMTKEQAMMYFPTSVHVGKPLPHKMKYLLMAPPKWGKTSFFVVPNALLLAFEEGHADISCFKIVITSWSVPLRERGVMEDTETGIKFASAMEVIDALEVYCPFEFVIIDTLDAASKMCTDHECDKAGLKHASDGGDYGKGWDVYQTNPFRRYYNRIVKLGVGVGGTTHVKEEWKKNKFGVEEFRRETSLPAGIQRFIHSQADVIINGSFGRRRKGHIDRDRIISFDGTNETMAGTRIKTIRLPVRYIPTPPTKEDPAAPWKQWVNFFENSPAAAIAAEEEYNQLLHGKDDESIPESPSAAVSQTNNNDDTSIEQQTANEAAKVDLTRVKKTIPPRPTRN